MSFVTRDTFSPALETTHTIDVPPNSRAGGVTLLLRAHLGSADVVAHLKRDGVQLQAWTNAPVDNGRAPGEWGSHTFQELVAAGPPERPATKAQEDESEEGPEFVLDEPEDLTTNDEHTLVIALKLRSLPQDRTEEDFYITYRLVYPDGGVQWLGSAGRDVRCVLRRSDPWLAAPGAALSESNGDPGTEVFRSVGMRESWGCWAIGNGRVQYHPQGHGTEDGMTFLVLVPRPRPDTLAVHQPIIIHGEALQLTSAGFIVCRSSTGARTRVYTAIASEPELSCALPSLGLRWLGIHSGHALIASSTVGGPAYLSFIPLLATTSSAPRRTYLHISPKVCWTSDSDRETEAGFAIFSPASKRVVSCDHSQQARLGVGPLGGTCVVSGMHTLPVYDGSTGEEESWRIALLTPHAIVLAVPETQTETAPAPVRPSVLTSQSRPAYASDGYVSDDEWVKEARSSRPDNRNSPASVSVSRRVVQYVIPLIWNTATLLLKTILVRLFAVIGVQPPALLMSLLSLSLPIAHEQVPSDPHLARNEAPPSEVESDAEVYASKGAMSTVSEANTEETCAPAPTALTFSIPPGQLSLLAVHSDGLQGTKTFRDVAKALDLILNGERLATSAVPLDRVSAVLETRTKVEGGRFAVLGAAHRDLNGF
ncbi:hypothetical protein OF83DRAFT_1167678 [Amylostereum chailletii]|nr:hypothetical protein OF83DRAFT_1167678 [Amylostereum chailletii]